jgi:hypothetical protein
MKLMDLLDEETVKKICFLRRQVGIVTTPEVARKVVAPNHSREMERMMQARAYCRRGRRIRQTRFC